MFADDVFYIASSVKRGVKKYLTTLYSDSLAQIYKRSINYLASDDFITIQVSLNDNIFNLNVCAHQTMESIYFQLACILNTYVESVFIIDSPFNILCSLYDDIGTRFLTNAVTPIRIKENTTIKFSQDEVTSFAEKVNNSFSEDFKDIFEHESLIVNLLDTLHSLSPDNAAEHAINEFYSIRLAACEILSSNHDIDTICTLFRDFLNAHNEYLYDCASAKLLPLLDDTTADNILHSFIHKFLASNLENKQGNPIICYIIDRKPEWLHMYADNIAQKFFLVPPIYAASSKRLNKLTISKIVNYLFDNNFDMLISNLPCNLYSQIVTQSYEMYDSVSNLLWIIVIYLIAGLEALYEHLLTFSPELSALGRSFLQCIYSAHNNSIIPYEYFADISKNIVTSFEEIIDVFSDEIIIKCIKSLSLTLSEFTSLDIASDLGIINMTTNELFIRINEEWVELSKECSIRVSKQYVEAYTTTTDHNNMQVIIFNTPIALESNNLININPVISEILTVIAERNAFYDICSGIQYAIKDKSDIKRDIVYAYFACNNADLPKQINRIRRKYDVNDIISITETIGDQIGYSFIFKFIKNKFTSKPKCFFRYLLRQCSEKNPSSVKMIKKVLLYIERSNCWMHIYTEIMIEVIINNDLMRSNPLIYDLILKILLNTYLGDEEDDVKSLLQCMKNRFNSGDVYTKKLINTIQLSPQLQNIYNSINTSDENKCLEALENFAIILETDIANVDIAACITLLDGNVSVLYRIIFNMAAREDDKIFNNLIEAIIMLYDIQSPNEFDIEYNISYFMRYLSDIDTELYDTLSNDIKYYEKTYKNYKDVAYWLHFESGLTNENNISLLINAMCYYDNTELFNKYKEIILSSTKSFKELQKKIIQFHAMEIFNASGIDFDIDCCKHAIKYQTSSFFINLFPENFKNLNALKHALDHYDLATIILNLDVYCNYSYPLGESNAIQYLGIFYSTSIASFFYEAAQKRDLSDRFAIGEQIDVSSCDMSKVHDLKFVYAHNTCYMDSLMQAIFSLNLLETTELINDSKTIFERIIALYQLYAIEGKKVASLNLLRFYLIKSHFVSGETPSEPYLLLTKIFDEVTKIREAFTGIMNIKQYNVWIPSRGQIEYELFKDTDEETTQCFVNCGIVSGEYYEITGYGPNFLKNDIGIDIQHSAIIKHSEYFWQAFNNDVKFNECVDISYVRYKAVSCIIHTGKDNNNGHFVAAFPSVHGWEIVDGLSKQKKNINLNKLSPLESIALVIYKSIDDYNARNKYDNAVALNNIHPFTINDDTRNIIQEAFSYEDNQMMTRADRERVLNKLISKDEMVHAWLKKFRNYKLNESNYEMKAFTNPLFKLCCNESNENMHQDKTEEERVAIDANKCEQEHDQKKMCISESEDHNKIKNVIGINKNTVIPGIIVPASDSYKIIPPLPNIFLQNVKGIQNLDYVQPLDEDIPPKIAQIMKYDRAITYTNIFISTSKAQNCFIPATFQWFVIPPHTKPCTISAKRIKEAAIDIERIEKMITSDEDIVEVDNNIYEIANVNLFNECNAKELSVLNARKERLIKALKREKEQKDIAMTVFDAVYGSDETVRLLMKNIHEKKTCNDTRGMRYSSVFIKFWMRTQFRNPEIIKFLREHFDGPCEGTTYNWRKQILNDMPSKIKWESKEDISDIIKFWIAKLEIKQLNCIVATDAMHVTTRIEVKNSQLEGIIESCQQVSDDLDRNRFRQIAAELIERGYASEAEFVVMLVPLSRAKPIPIHFHPKNNGSASENEINIIEYIENKIRTEFAGIINLYGKASDGDVQYIEWETTFFNKFITSFRNHGFSLTCTIKDTKPSEMVNADLPHLLKRLRNNTTNNEKYTSFGNIELHKSNLKEKLQSIFIYDIALDDIRKLKMDDAYPRALFTPTAACLLIKEEIYEYLQIMLPGIILRLVLYNDEMKRKDRLYILVLGYYYMLIIHDMKNGASNYIYTNEQMTDYCNLCVHIMKVIQTIPDEMSMERIGTYVLEHFFSSIRSMARSDDSAINTENAFIRMFASISLTDNLVCEKRTGYNRPAYLEPGIALLTEEQEKKAKDIAFSLHAIYTKENIYALPYSPSEKADATEQIQIFNKWLQQWPDIIPKCLSTNRNKTDQKNRQLRIEYRIFSPGIGATMKSKTGRQGNPDNKSISEILDKYQA